MGKKHIMQLILKKSKEKLGCGIVFAVASGLAILLIQISIGLFSCDLRVILGLSAILIIGIMLIVNSTETLRDPYGAEELIKNPDLFRQADEILLNEIYRDKYMILSERVIANASDLLQMAYRDEVFLVYIYILKGKYGTQTRYLKLETARGTIEINITREVEYEIDELINRICKFCKYAKAGYSEDGRYYLEKMRELWRIDRSRKQEEELC